MEGAPQERKIIDAGISDMLVQGWGDCIRVFPAVPARWKNWTPNGKRISSGQKTSSG
jgi:hypothetical protein